MLVSSESCAHMRKASGKNWVRTGISAALCDKLVLYAANTDTEAKLFGRNQLINIAPPVHGPFRRLQNEGQERPREEDTWDQDPSCPGASEQTFPTLPCAWMEG